MFNAAKKSARTLTAITLLTMGALSFSQGRSGTPNAVGGGEEAQAVATALENPDLRRQAEIMGRRLLAGQTAAAAQNAETIWKGAGLDPSTKDFNKFQHALVELAQADSIIEHFRKHNYDDEALTGAELRKISEINSALTHFRTHANGWPPALVAAVSHGLVNDFEHIVDEVEAHAASRTAHSKEGIVGWFLDYAERTSTEEFAELAGHLRWLERQNP